MSIHGYASRRLGFAEEKGSNDTIYRTGLIYTKDPWYNELLCHKAEPEMPIPCLFANLVQEKPILSEEEAEVQRLTDFYDRHKGIFRYLFSNRSADMNGLIAAPDKRAFLIERAARKAYTHPMPLVNGLQEIAKTDLTGLVCLVMGSFFVKKGDKVFERMDACIDLKRRWIVSWSRKDLPPLLTTPPVPFTSYFGSPPQSEPKSNEDKCPWCEPNVRGPLCGNHAWVNLHTNDWYKNGKLQMGAPISAKHAIYDR